VYSPRPGLIRIDLRDIWVKSGLEKTTEPNIRLDLYDNQEDGVVYVIRF
jgi:hypothetical protein